MQEALQSELFKEHARVFDNADAKGAAHAVPDFHLDADHPDKVKVIIPLPKDKVAATLQALANSPQQTASQSIGQSILNKGPKSSLDAALNTKPTTDLPWSERNTGANQTAGVGAGR